jgi:hypothetical protein
LETFARVIRARIPGSHDLHHIVGFIDGTLRKMARPSVRQQFYYSGHKHAHGLKFQAVVFPDGIIGHVAGPFPGRIHDSAMLAASGLEEFILHDPNFQLLGGPPHNFVLYADSGYATTEAIFSSISRDPSLHPFFQLMSRFRVSVEWAFGYISSTFRANNLSQELHPTQAITSQMYLLSILLSNLKTCMEGHNEVSSYFSLRPPTLMEYLYGGEEQ